MTRTDSNKKPLTVPCPTCRAPVLWDSRWKPFCSERCRLIDLGDWATEAHRIAGEPVNPDTDPGSQD